MTGDRVEDWATDYNIFDPSYAQAPYQVWDDLRKGCPIAHTSRWGGSWMPTRYEDLFAIAKDVEHFSSIDVGVASVDPGGAQVYNDVRIAPIASDPPEHTWTRALLLPRFTQAAIERLEPTTRELCTSLIDGFIDARHADAASDYAQQIPTRVIAEILGVPQEMSETFVGWVRGALEFAVADPARGAQARVEIFMYLQSCIEQRRDQPGDDLITYLVQSEVNGERVPERIVLGMSALLLVAGIDTTWSSIGSALLHLATHPGDRERLVREPELIPTAVEEFLRAYSPVTMARIVREDVEYQGQAMCAGDRVLMSFPAANRDPEKFEDADRVIIDRARNPHIAFGVGIHRCVGSNLARMELRVALAQWLARIPEFHLDDSAEVTWAGGQVRGPRSLPVLFP